MFELQDQDVKVWKKPSVQKPMEKLDIECDEMQLDCFIRRFMEKLDISERRNPVIVGFVVEKLLDSLGYDGKFTMWLNEIVQRGIVRGELMSDDLSEYLEKMENGEVEEDKDELLFDDYKGYLEDIKKWRSRTAE